MRWLLFLARLSFICGLFFLLSVSLLVKDWIHSGSLQSTIITIGYVMGLLLIPAANLCCLGVFIIKKKLWAYVPRWLVLGNVLFLLALIYFIFYLNDPYYHQR